MMDWEEKQSCVKCNRGGKLLFCNETDCPIAVHEKCIGCAAKFDDMGNFHCPYCLYKRAVAETRQLRDKAMLAKKALSAFMDKVMIGGNCENPKVGIAERKEVNASAVVGSKSCSDSENDLESDEVQNNTPQHRVEEGCDPLCTTNPLPCKETDESLVQKQNDGEIITCGEIPRRNDCRMMVVYQAHLKPVACGADNVQCTEEPLAHRLKSVEVGKRVQADHSVEADKCQDARVAESQQARRLSAILVEEETTSSSPLILSNKRKRKRNHPEMLKENDIVSRREREAKQKHTYVLVPQNVESSRRSPRVSSFEAVAGAVKCKEIIISSKCRQLKAPSNQFNTKSLNVRRRIFWTEEEEDMLKKGVDKFSTEINKNLPWRKILEFGRHVFHASPTPADLKDKWRNILKGSSTK